MPYLGNAIQIGDHTGNFKVLDDISTHTATFDGSASSVVSTSDNTIRIAEHRFLQGQRVTYTNGSGGNIGGLTSGTAYFIIFDTKNTIKLATNASNATSGTAINLSAVGTGTSHTLNVAFDGTNTQFKATTGGGADIRVSDPVQLNIAINNVVQKPNAKNVTLTEGFTIDAHNKIVFATAPSSNEVFWGSLIARTVETFDISDNKIDNFTGDGSTTEFTLSRVPPENGSIDVTIDGVTQHAGATRSFTLNASLLIFSAAPASGADIQVKHIGFAGATTNGVTGFYGRTGNVALTSTDHITTGDITSRNINSSGIITATSFIGNGSGLTGVASTDNIITGTAATFNTYPVDINAGMTVAGVSTFGAITATSFGGINATTGTFSGNVSVGGVLTYEDVTNIDSVGLITARGGINVTGGTLKLPTLPNTTTNSLLKIAIQDTDGTLKSDDTVLINPAQDVLKVYGTHISNNHIRASGNGPLHLTTANANGTVDLNIKHTHIEVNGNLLPATDSTDNLGSNTVRWANLYADTLYGDGSNLTGINADVVDDTSPQLGGTLDAGSYNIFFGDSNGTNTGQLRFGNGTDLKIYHDGTNTQIDSTTGEFRIKHTGNGVIKFERSSSKFIEVDGDANLLPYTNATVHMGYDGYRWHTVWGAAGNFSGTVTANAFSGSGANLTGIVISSDAQYNTIGGTNAGDSFSGTSAVQNTLFGYNAGTAITSGDYHTLVGYEAGKSVTTSEQITAIGWKAATNVTTGEMNAAIGSQCLFNVTTGSKNTAVGLCGRGVTTGDNNTFVGHLTGDEVTTGGNNTALGKSAKVGTTGTYNVALGSGSGSATCTGSHNIVSGYDAGDSMTSAQGNVFLGYEAGKANTSADHNIGIGYRAMIAATTGGSNQCIGEMSLYSLTTGSSNIAMGIYAGGAITSGTQNVSLGRNAGDIITTGSNNICLGYQADASANNVSNEVTIGNSSINHLRVPGIGVSFSEGGAVISGIVTATNFVKADGSAVGGVVSDAQNNTVGGTNAGDAFSGTDANHNTLYGFDAGTDVTTGDYNTFLGSRAAENCTTGSNNTIVGYYNARLLTTGGNNCAVGRATLNNITSQSSNTAIGDEAMISNQGSNQTAVGRMALASGGSGSDNVAVGYLAGGANTSGASNTYVGFRAGQTMQTGSNCIMIGHEAAPSSTGANNEITLGDSYITRFRIPGLGLDFNGANFDLGDSKKIRLGDSQDLQLYHDGSNSYLTNSTGTLILQTSSSGEIQLNGNGQHAAKFNPTGTSYIYYNGSVRFTIGATNTVHSEDFVPGANNTYDLGSSGSRWRNIYINDLQLSNEGSTNDVDGTWGDWTLQEGEHKIYMINNRTGKKYSLKMEEE